MPANAPATRLHSASRVSERCIASLFLAAAAAVLPACRQFQQHRVEVADLHARGQYQQIAAVLDSPDTRKLYGKRSDVLWLLDRGATALALNDTTTTLAKLEEAEKFTELRLQRTGADAAAAWLLNDSKTTYLTEPYEDLYVNVLKLLAQLEAGNVDGGASVEARRLGTKADALRDRYLKAIEAIPATDRANLDQRAAIRPTDPVLSATTVPRSARSTPRSAAQPPSTTTTSGQFVESTLGLYLSSITFLKSGNPDLAQVAARRLTQVIEAQGPLIGPVRAADFNQLESLRASEVNVLAVALSGRGPSKVADTVGPVPIGTVPIYFELPRLVSNPSSINGARLEFEPVTSTEAQTDSKPASDGQAVPNSSSTPVRAIPLNLIEDLNAVATENHRRALPLIYARTYARAAAKAIASAAVTETFRKKSSDRDQDLAQLGGVLLGLAFMAATEEADLRCWAMLPGQAHVAAARLEPGRYRLRIVYQSPAGNALYITPWQTASLSEGSLFTIVTHYWN